MHHDFDSRLKSSLVQKGKFNEIIHKHHCLKLVLCTDVTQAKGVFIHLQYNWISAVTSDHSHVCISECM